MKRTRLQRAELYAASVTDDIVAQRHSSRAWLVGHDAGTRDAQRRMARKFKRGLRLSWDKP